jgi:hypothetical protein
MSNHKGEYDPGKYIVVAKSHGSPNVRIRFQIDPEHRKAVEAIVWSRRFRYRYPCDFYRHAVQVLLHLLSGSRELEKVFAEYQLILDDRDREEAEYYVLAFQVLEEQIDHHLSAGQIGRARRLLQRTVVRLRRQSRSCWRDNCLEKIQQRWWALLEGVYYPSCLRHERLPSRQD